MSAVGALILSFAVSSLGLLCLPGWHPHKASPIAVYILGIMGNIKDYRVDVLEIMGYIKDYRVYVLGIMEKKIETTIMGYIFRRIPDGRPCPATRSLASWRRPAAGSFVF